MLTWQRCSYTTRTEDLTDATAAGALNLSEEYIGRILGLTMAELKAWQRRNAAADQARAEAVKAQMGHDLFGGRRGDMQRGRPRGQRLESPGPAN